MSQTDQRVMMPAGMGGRLYELSHSDGRISWVRVLDGGDTSPPMQPMVANSPALDFHEAVERFKEADTNRRD